MHNRSALATFPYRSAMLCAFAACLFSAAVLAQGTSPAPGTQTTTLDPQAQYKLDVDRCNKGETNQDRATCIREAGAALDEAKRNRLTNGQGTSYEKNATDRCNALPEDQRQACLLQMSGQNTTVEGSVGGGGILRETTITIPAPAQPDSSMPQPTSPMTAPATPSTTPAMPSTAPAAPYGSMK